VKTVVIADDDQDTRELVRAALTRSGYEVQVAEDGDEAWELLKRYRPRVAVLDVQMPGRTGLELVAAIRADADLRTTYVLLLTGERLERDVLAGQDAGTNRYLIKPFSVAGLTQAVAQGFELGPSREPPAWPERAGW
jgi:DNA-binding response OmpR family regulator